MKVNFTSSKKVSNFIFTMLMVLVSLVISTEKTAAQLLVEDFSQTSGTLITASTSPKWGAFSGAGSNAITITTPGLTYGNYAGSGVGNAVTMTTSGEDDTTARFTPVTTGSLYVACMIKVTSAQTSGDHFIEMMSSSSTTTFIGKIFIKSSGTGFLIGVGKGAAANVIYDNSVLNFNTVYFVVMKYTFNTGSTTDDVMSLYVNPTLGGAEPTPLIAPQTTGTGTDGTSINQVALRQGAAANAPALVIDGIRAGTTWASVTPTSSSIAPTVTTTAATSINGTTAVTGGNVTADGGVAVTRRGLIYSTSAITDTTNTTGGGKIVDANGGTGAFTANLNGLTVSTTYNIRAFAVNSVGVSYGSNLTFTTLAQDITPAPTAQPTNYNVTSLTCNGMTVNWTAASPSADGYIVLQTSGGTAPNTDPTSTTAYTVGQTIGNASVAYVGSGTSFSLSSLPDGTTYNFKIYSYNGSGVSTSYLTTSPLTGSTATLAPSAITASAATNIYSNTFTANWNGTANCANSYSLTLRNPDGFENLQTLFTASGTGGSFMTGINSTGNPSTAAFYNSGTYGYVVNNGTTTLTSVPFNTSSLVSPSLTFKIAAYSYGATTNGIDATDTLKVEISPDNGTTWYPTASVCGSVSNAFWAFTAAGSATTAYDGDNTVVGFAGNGSGGGISTMTITNLPTVSKLRVRIYMKNNAAAEAWAVDDFSLFSTISAVSGTSYVVNNATAGAPWSYTINSVGTNSTASSNVITLNTLAAAVPTFGTSSVANITNTTADLTANVATLGSTADISVRGIALKTSTGVTATDNSQADASTTTGSFTQTRTLSPETKYYFAGYATNAEGTGLSAETNFFTLSNPPTAQASGLSTIPFSSSQLDLNWNSAEFPASGATAKRYMLLMAVSPEIPSFTGVNGAAPTVGANTVVVNQNISGDATSASATGLSSGASYNFLLIPYTWDGANAATYNYLTTNAATASGTTSTVAPPVLSASTVASITATSAVLGATLDSDGGASIVQRGTVYSTTSPVGITNNTLEEGGTSVGTFSHIRSDLQPMTKYYFAGYAVNSGGSLALSPQASFYTLATAPLAQSSSLVATPISGSQVSLSWSSATFAGTAGAVNGYLVLRSTSPDVAAVTNTNGQAPVAATGTTIMASTGLTSYASTGLTGNTQYYYTIIPYSWDGVHDSTYSYLTTAAPFATATTFATAPTAQPTSLVFSNITCNGMTLTWKNAIPAATGYIVLRSSGATAPDADPISGTVYTTGGTLGNATVLYVGTDTTVVSSSLSDAAYYNYKIYAYNGSESNNISYLTASPLAGTQMTAIPATPTAVAATTITLNGFQANWNASNCATTGYLLDVSTFANFYDPSVPAITVASEGFESGTTLFTASGTGGSIKTGSSASGDRPATSTFFTEGNSGYGAANGTAVLTSSSINTASTVTPQLTLKLAAFSVGSTTNGPDATFDQIKVEISPDGGATWNSTATFNGNNSAYWAFSATGAAVTAYDGDNTAVNFQAPSAGNNAAGYSSLTITNLPNVADMRVRITMQTNSTAELWVIDDFKITGRTGSFVSPYQGYAVAAPAVAQSVSGLTLNTNYYYRVRGAGQNANSNYSNTISVTTDAGYASLSAPTASNITNTSADLSSAVLTPGSGSGISERGTVYSTSAGVTASNNLLAEGGTTIDAFTQTRTGLSAETRYYFAAYATNSYGTGLSTESSFITLSNPPTSAAASFAATTFSGDQINLSWTPATFPATGATVKGYVILRALYPTVPTLTNGNASAPVADANSTIVTSILTANGTTASAEGLAGLTHYNFAIIPFTWNGTDPATYNYYTSSIPTANATTLTAVTALAPTGFATSAVTCDGMAVNWTTGVGADGTLVLQTSGAVAPNTNPTPGVEYTIGQTIGNATVAYVGTGSNFTISSLIDNTTYRFKLFSYNGSGANIGYLTASTLAGTQTTALADAPVANAGTAITSSSFVANWSAASCAANYQLFVYTNGANKPVSGWTFPLLGTTVTADTASNYTNANNIGKTITLSSGTISSVSGLTTQAASATTWTTVGKNWQVIVNTTGYTNILLSSVQYSSASGPKDFKVQYKVGAAGTWADVTGGSYTVATNFTTGVVSNLALPAECEGVTDLYIRWATTSTTAVNGTTIGGTNTGGTNRIDNIFVTGTKFELVSAYNGLVNAGTSANVTGLLPSTTYYYYVKSLGQSNSASLQSNVQSVTTYADQSVADFRTKASGSFSDASIWEYNYDGSNYVAATNAPGINNNVNIRSVDSVYLDLDFNIAAGKSMTINGTMNANTKLLFGNGSVVVAPASTFITAHANGMTTTGSITTTGRTFSDSANYVYNGTVAQTTGSLPSPLKGNVIVYNNVGLNVSTNRVVTAPGSFVVKSGAVVSFGSGSSTNTYSLTGTGNFTAETGSTLIITSSNGISTPTILDTLGCIRVTGTRSFANGINYNFTKNDGSSVSRLGTSFGTEISGINNLTINNPMGALLNASDITVNGTLALVSGKLSTGTYKVSLPVTAALTKTDTTWVIGNLEKTVATGATSVTYEVGADNANYSPITVAFGNVTTGGTLIANAVSGVQSQLASSVLSSSKRLNFYAQLSGSGLAFDTYSATINYKTGNILGSANTNALICGNYDGAAWSYPSVVARTSTSITLNGMTALGSLAVAEVNCTIAASVSSNSPICSGDAITLTGGSTGANGSVTYSWSGPNSFSSTLQSPSINSSTTSNSGVYTLTVTDAFGCSANSTTTVVVNNCNTTLNVKAFLEGYYRGGGTMASTLYDLTLSADATATDSIQVNLWSASSLGNATPNYSVKVLLHTNGTATAIFPGATLGNAYYVAIQHRNSIETWSANPVTIDATTSYDFTTGLDKAYSDGVNAALKSLGDGSYGFYGGDVNQDGTVDGSDMNDVDNNTALGAFGYDSSDVNGDGATDGLDMNVVDNNTQAGLFYARPY